jgi:hypothetical protein
MKLFRTLLEIAALIAATFVSYSLMQPAKAGSPAAENVASIVALQEFAAHSSATPLNVVSYYSGSTRGGGLFVWDAANVSAPNPCTIFQIRGNSTGRWVRKFNGPLDVAMCGAKQDGVSDDTLPIQTALNLAAKYGGTVIITRQAACAIITNVLQIGSNTKFAGIGYPCLKFTTAATSGEITLAGSNSVVSGLAVTSEGALGTQLGCKGTYCSNVTIKDNIYNRPGKAGPIIALNDASATWKNISIADNFMVGGSFGILVNTAQHGSGLVIANNFVGGVDADAIELNTTSNNWTDTTVTGNVLDSSAATTPPAAGFGIGIARGLRITVSGNAILGSAHHGIHVEDGSSDINITGNIIGKVGRGRNGIDLLQNTAVPVKRITITDNTLGADVPGTGIGIASNFTSSGIPINTLVSGNVIDDFGTGIWTVGSDLVFNNKIFSSQNHYTGIFAIEQATQAIHNNLIISIAANCVACVPVFARNGGKWGPVTVAGPADSEYQALKRARTVVASRIVFYKQYLCGRKPKLNAKMTSQCKVD